MMPLIGHHGTKPTLVSRQAKRRGALDWAQRMIGGDNPNNATIRINTHRSDAIVIRCHPLLENIGATFFERDWRGFD